MDDKKSQQGLIGEIATEAAKNEIESQNLGLEQIKTDMANLKSEIRQLKEDLEKERPSAMLVIGIFASVITFLSVQVQILAHVQNIYQLGFLSILMLAGIALFNYFVFALVHFKDQKNIFSILIPVVITFLLVIAFIFAHYMPILIQ